MPQSCRACRPNEPGLTEPGQEGADHPYAPAAGWQVVTEITKLLTADKTAGPLLATLAYNCANTFRATDFLGGWDACSDFLQLRLAVIRGEG
jgi:hypothetical protein